MTGDLSFNTNDLQTYVPAAGVGIVTNQIKHTDAPDLLMSVVPKADANGSIIPSLNYSSRKIMIAGAIIGNSQNDLDSRIDTFKSYFVGKNKNLDIVYNGSTRRYIATPLPPKIERQDRALFAEFTVEFVCTNPFGIDLTATEITDQSAYASATLTVTPTITGNAPYQLPIATITINSLTGTGDYIQLSNDLNGQSLLLYGLGLAASDVVVIDAENRQVTLNGVPVDYSGTFLELEPGANSITYTDGFTTRSVDILIEYYKRYL